MKKFFAFILAFALSFSLAACDSGEDNKEKDPPENKVEKLEPLPEDSGTYAPQLNTEDLEELQQEFFSDELLGEFEVQTELELETFSDEIIIATGYYEPDEYGYEYTERVYQDFEN